MSKAPYVLSALLATAAAAPAAAEEALPFAQIREDNTIITVPVETEAGWTMVQIGWDETKPASAQLEAKIHALDENGTIFGGVDTVPFHCADDLSRFMDSIRQSVLHPADWDIAEQNIQRMMNEWFCNFDRTTLKDLTFITPPANS